MIPPEVRRQLRSANAEARAAALAHVEHHHQSSSVDETIIDDLLAVLAAHGPSNALARAVVATPSPRLLAAYDELLAPPERLRLRPYLGYLAASWPG